MTLHCLHPLSGVEQGGLISCSIHSQLQWFQSQQQLSRREAEHRGQEVPQPLPSPQQDTERRMPLPGKGKAVERRGLELWLCAGSVLRIIQVSLRTWFGCGETFWWPLST